MDRKEMSPEYQKRREVSKKLTEERTKLEKAAHAARQDHARARNINEAIRNGRRVWWDLSQANQTLLIDFSVGELYQVRDECDSACRWNRQMRIAAVTAVVKPCSP